MREKSQDAIKESSPSRSRPIENSAKIARMKLKETLVESLVIQQRTIDHCSLDDQNGMCTSDNTNDKVCETKQNLSCRVVGKLVSLGLQIHNFKIGQ